MHEEQQLNVHEKWPLSFDITVKVQIIFSNAGISENNCHPTIVIEIYKNTRATIETKPLSGSKWLSLLNSDFLTLSLSINRYNTRDKCRVWKSTGRYKPSFASVWNMTWAVRCVQRWLITEEPGESSHEQTWKLAVQLITNQKKRGCLLGGSQRLTQTPVFPLQIMGRETKVCSEIHTLSVSWQADLASNL